MRKNLTTAALVLALSCPAFAGIIHTPSATQPPPSTTQGEPGGVTSPPPNDETTAAVLNVLAALLALL